MKSRIKSADFGRQPRAVRLKQPNDGLILVFIPVALAAIVILALTGCSFLETPGPTPLPPSPTATPTVPPPTAAAGWIIHKSAGFQLALPGTWQEVPLDDAALKKQIDAASKNNPHLADTLRGILTNGQNKSLSFFAADVKSGANIVENVSVVRATLPAGTSAADATNEFATNLSALLKGGRLVAYEAPLHINGQAAGEIDYDLPLVNGAGQVVTVRGVQYLFSSAGGAFILTVTGDAGREAEFVPRARQIAQTFFLIAN